jgi:LysM repeat protein
MKFSLVHLLTISALLCSSVTGQAASYTIKPGDSLARIARRHGCSAQDLAKANGMKLDSVIHPGQTLKLPAKEGAAGGASAVPAEGSHLIKPGETLTGVARQYGIPLDALYAANPGIDAKTLKVGQKIRLAAAASSDRATAAAAPAETRKETARAAEAGTTTQESPGDEPPAAETEAKIRTIMVDKEITFGDFAAHHGTDIVRLNDLNGLDLTSATVLAKGSELYVPAQP